MKLNWPQIVAWSLVGGAAYLLLLGGVARAVLALALISAAGWMFARS